MNIHLSQQSSNMSTSESPMVSETTHNLTSLAEHASQILEALYLVSSHITEHDPVVSMLKEKGTAVMNTLFLLDTNQSEKNHVLSVREVTHMLDTISAGLRILSRAEKISEPNTRIITEQINLLKGNIENLSFPKDIQEEVIHTPLYDIFSSPMKDMVERKSDLLIPDLSDSDERPVFVKKVSPLLRTSVSLKTLPQTKEKIKEPSKTKIDTSHNVSHKNTAKNNDAKIARKDNILKILKQKKNASITDIGNLFKDCSLKTIQRDLTELIDEGKVTKTGSRRWSLYNLV